MFFIKVGSGQQAAMATMARTASEHRIFALLRTHYANSSVWPGDEQALKVVQAGIYKANEYDMPAERDAFKLAALMLVFGDDFDLHEAWARDIVAARLGNAPIAELFYREGISQIRAREQSNP